MTLRKTLERTDEGALLSACCALCVFRFVLGNDAMGLLGDGFPVLVATLGLVQAVAVHMCHGENSSATDGRDFIFEVFTRDVH